MTSFTNSPKGKIKKADIDIAKNYLDENEMKTLGLLVEQYLAFAETQAMQQKPMYMKDWIKKLNDILTLNEREILNHAGKISHEQAAKKAETEYEKYKEKQKMIEKENSLKELEEDLKKMKAKKK